MPAFFVRGSDDVIATEIGSPPELLANSDEDSDPWEHTAVKDLE